MTSSEQAYSLCRGLLHRAEFRQSVIQDLAILGTDPSGLKILLLQGTSRCPHLQNSLGQAFIKSIIQYLNSIQEPQYQDLEACSILLDFMLDCPIIQSVMSMASDNLIGCILNLGLRLTTSQPQLQKEAKSVLLAIFCKLFNSRKQERNNLLRWLYLNTNQKQALLIVELLLDMNLVVMKFEENPDKYNLEVPLYHFSLVRRHTYSRWDGSHGYIPDLDFKSCDSSHLSRGVLIVLCILYLENLKSMSLGPGSKLIQFYAQVSKILAHYVRTKPHHARLLPVMFLIGLCHTVKFHSSHLTLSLASEIISSLICILGFEHLSIFNKVNMCYLINQLLFLLDPHMDTKQLCSENREAPKVLSRLCRDMTEYTGFDSTSIYASTQIRNLFVRFMSDVADGVPGYDPSFLEQNLDQAMFCYRSALERLVQSNHASDPQLGLKLVNVRNYLYLITLADSSYLIVNFTKYLPLVIFILEKLLHPDCRELAVTSAAEIGFSPKNDISHCVHILTKSSCDALLDILASKAGLLNKALQIYSLYCRPEHHILVGFKELVERVNRAKGAGEVPDRFLDGLTRRLMRDPVMLPNSGKIVDRTTADRILGPESGVGLVPQPALRQELQAFWS